MPAPTLDPSGSFVTDVSGTSSASVTLSTTDTDDIIVALIGWSSPSVNATLSSISGGGLTWAKRTASVGSSHNNHVEVWWAHAAAALTSQSITAMVSASVDHIRLLVFGVNGCNVSAPWDTNTGLSNGGAGNWVQQSNPDSSGAQIYNSPTFTTNQADDYIMLLQSGNSGAGTSSRTGTAAGMSQVALVSSAAGSDWSSGSVFAEGVTSTQSGASIAYSTIGAGTPAQWAIDALTANTGGATETATATMALSGVSYNAAAGDSRAGATMALSGVSFNATATRKETATVTMALFGIGYNVHANPAAAATATMALSGISISAQAIDVNALNPLRQFSTFG